MTRAEEYRCRAQECLELARNISLKTARQSLLDMAETWLRLAQEQGPPPGQAEPPPRQQQQQQQQVQPKDDKKE
jgi:hypothetical protein